MSRRLVYLDQNVIGMLVDGGLYLPRLPEVCWVYSKEHFAEMKRSSNPEPFLTALEKLGAKLLDTELNSQWKITGTARLFDFGSPTQHYDAYLEATKGYEGYDNLFDPLIAWINGGNDEGPFKDVPERLAEEVLNLINGQPTVANLTENLNTVSNEFYRMIEQMLEHGNDITKTRKALGAGKGAFGTISGENQLRKIWEIIGPTCPNMSCDQFFGFDPIDKQGYDEWPVYLGIVGCCAVMDIIGFQAEKKCRKLDKLPNVRSDANHIAMGAFCSALLSQDQRLLKRAKAIYEYKSITTAILLVNVESVSQLNE